MEEGYEPDLQDELLGLPLQKRLYKEAVPSRNLIPLDVSSPTKIPSERHDRRQ